MLWQGVDEVTGDAAVQNEGRLRIQKRDALPQDLLLVETSLVARLVQQQGDRDAQHQRRDQLKVVRAASDEHHDRQRHLLEAAQHGCAADHRVNAGDRDAVWTMASHESTCYATGESTDQHRAREIARGDGHAREPDVQGRVHDERQELVHGVDLVGVLAREEPLHRALGRREQQRRHGVILVLLAVEAHPQPRELLIRQLLALRHERHAGVRGSAERGIEESVHSLCEALPPPERTDDALPEACHRQAGASVERAEWADEGGEDDEKRNVLPTPRLRFWVPLEDHEGLRCGPTQIQQCSRQERADGCARESTNCDLQWPRSRCDLLEHVQNATDRRIEEHRHSTCTANRADDALGVSEALLVDHLRRTAARAKRIDVHPATDVGEREAVGYEEGEIAAHCYCRSLPTNRKARCVREDSRGSPEGQVPESEESRNVVAIQPSFVLRSPRTRCAGREAKNQEQAHRP
mmetsp:Transcript_50895/g.142432  ORF Transcript_50895/g.142432 Transcript_50895/m.142432 type:complete len:466 (-) Transcript_50895:430-1827(-)